MNDFHFANNVANIFNSHVKTITPEELDNIINDTSCYLPHFKKIYESTLRYHDVKSGRGGAKTSQIARMIIQDSFNPKLAYTNFACGREFAKNLEETSYNVIELLIHDLGYSDYFNFIPSKKRIINKINNVKIYFMGCQNANHFTSIPNLSRIWLDEIANIDRYSIERIFKSVRGSIIPTKQYSTKIYCSYNPVLQLDPISVYLQERINGGMGTSTHVNIEQLPPDWQDSDLMAELLIDKANDIDLYKWIWLGEPRPDIQYNLFQNVIYENLVELPKRPVIAFIDPSFTGGDTTAISLLWLENTRIKVTGYAFKNSWYELDEQILTLFNKFNIVEFYYESNMLGDSVSNHFYTKYGKYLIPHLNKENKVNRIYKIGYYLKNMDFINPFPLFIDNSSKLWKTQITNYNRDVSIRPKLNEHDDAPDSLASIFIVKNW